MNLQGERRIPFSVFQDLQFAQIFSDDVVQVLSHPCDAAEIKARQDFFRLLENTDFFEKVSAFYTVLERLNKLEILKRQSANTVSRFWILKEQLKGYLDAHQALSLLKGCSLTDRIIEARSNSAHLNLLASVKADLAEMEHLLSTVQLFDLSFSVQSWLTPDHQSESFYERIVASAKSLGLKTEPQKSDSIPPDETLSHAVTALFPAQINALKTYHDRYDSLPIADFLNDRKELKFFLEVHRFTKKHSLPHCYPLIAPRKEIWATDAYDVFLISKNVNPVIPNDIFVTEEEPFFFLLGANGGGKTTYIRTVGINLILFLSGCPIFAKKAEIFPFDTVLSHFPKDECFTNVGRLDEEFLRVEEMLRQPNAFFLFNETFSGTDDQRGSQLALDVADKMKTHKKCGIFVTHFYEVEKADFPILQPLVDINAGNTRTYKITKKSKVSSSYAADILKKYRLDYQSLVKRRHGDAT